MTAPPRDGRARAGGGGDVGGVLAAALAGGFAAFAYFVGAAVLTFRYDGFGLPGQQLVGVTPREQLLVRGTVTLLLWTAIGSVFFGLAAVAERKIQDRDNRRRALTAMGGLAAVALIILIFAAHVFWPLLMVVAVMLFMALPFLGAAHGVARVAICVVAIGLVALSYESDRLHYGIEWSVARLRAPDEVAEGVLIGQNDRGLYLGVEGRPGRRLTVLFIPSGRVVSLRSTPQRRTVDTPAGEARREPVRLRIWHAPP